MIKLRAFQVQATNHLETDNISHQPSPFTCTIIINIDCRQSKELPPLLAPRSEPISKQMSKHLALMLKPVDYDPMAEAMKLCM